MTMIISKVQQRETVIRELGNALPANFPKDDYEFVGEINLKETIKNKKLIYKKESPTESKKEEVK